MARPILMPQVGQDLTEGKITAINVKLGDKIKKGDIVAEVESEKATFEVEAFETGTVIEVRYKVGDTATVLQPLIMVGEAGEAPSTNLGIHQPTSTAGETASKAPVEVAASAQGYGSSVGSSPLARRIAKEAGVRVGDVQGSGPHGAVVKKDIEAVVEKHRATGRTLTKEGDGSDLRSLQQGSGDPVVLIHGFGADLSAWRPFILHLALTNPVLALDLPGHGANLAVGPDDFDTLVASVNDTLRAAGVSRLHLVGHSLGAAVAASLAGGGDLDVRSLALISPAGLGPLINGEFVSGFLAANSEAELKPWLEKLVHRPAMLPGALVRATIAAREASPLVAAQGRLAAKLFAGNTQLFSIRDALDRYTGPLRLIVGQEDGIIPTSYADEIPPHVASHRLPLVGHLPQFESASLVARLVAATVRSAG
ncbi:MAG: acetoin dehydrogenase dihydrolipoyllysine-residue acetyltransferase subunit [Aestuariivirga sp.]|jgi:pimeloyl-ACP methyl ester carboxylesterase|uniref:acetoin dehydrogenase dihydrolipoyllysine-residue acetyltransferase subunit n=1 Tax=Aestuariivirga sp. TaxID=2650926 RepID=UPI003019AFA1